jgi:hypothetical protein
MKIVQRFAIALLLLITTAGTASAASAQWCPTSWSDYVTYANGDFL